MAERLQTYAEFWPFYLGEHSRRGTRALHFIGTGLALMLLAMAIATLDWRLFSGAVIAGYAFAWIAHLTVEHNQPATFTYPLWSLASDLRMFGLFAAGRLEGELRKYRIDAQ
jgi:hypothetical protein